ncbi:MAG: hypothetical protein H0V17_30530 [Deltaproteobacteria bacterium]|nr:hypothetical protein [Deltaproteobacteria bacterium]
MTATRIDIADGVVAWLDDVEVSNAIVWVLSSDGLRAFDHPELVLPVRAHPQLDRDATARTLAQVIGAITRAAQSGQRVAAGGTTRFGGQVLGFDGVCYMPATPIGAFHAPASSLIGIFVAADELDGVEQFGARRLASVLARQTRYFPYPPWTDPARERFAIGRWPSVLGDMPHVGLPGATITQEGGALHFRLGRVQSAAILRNVLPQVPPTTPLTFALHAVSATADGCLVWAPEQQAPEGVAPPGSRGERLGGCFLATANQQAANGSQIVEDGFAYFLRDPDYTNLRAAWEAQRDITIRGDRAGDDLIVTWVDEVAAEAPQQPGRVRIVSVQLTVEPQDGSAGVASYIKALAAVVERALPSYGTAYEMMIEVKPLAPITLGTRPISPPQDAMERCLAELHAVPMPRVTGELGFQLHLSIDG